MSQTTEQLLVTGVFDFTTLFQPDYCNTIDRFQLLRLVHTLEDDLTLVRKCKLERTFFGYDFLSLLLGAVSKEIHILKDLFEQRKSRISMCVINFSHNKDFSLLCQTFENQFESDMIRL